MAAVWKLSLRSSVLGDSTTRRPRARSLVQLQVIVGQGLSSQSLCSVQNQVAELVLSAGWEGWMASQCIS